MHTHASATERKPANLANRLLTENLVDLSDAARHLGNHVGTLHRWRLHGVRGVRLEVVRVGGRWMTSWQALDRLISSTNSAQPEPPQLAAGTRRSRAAERELRAEGL